jgi:hypothetical protein
LSQQMNITIYKPAEVELLIREGDPPVDQSAEVAALVAERDAAAAALAAVTAERDALAVKIAAAKAALE